MMNKNNWRESQIKGRFTYIGIFELKGEYYVIVDNNSITGERLPNQVFRLHIVDGNRKLTFEV
jgi:hypothetical protein